MTEKDRQLKRQAEAIERLASLARLVVGAPCWEPVAVPAEHPIDRDGRRMRRR